MNNIRNFDTTSKINWKDKYSHDPISGVGIGILFGFLKDKMSKEVHNQKIKKNEKMAKFLDKYQKKNSENNIYDFIMKILDSIRDYANDPVSVEDSRLYLALGIQFVQFNAGYYHASWLYRTSPRSVSADGKIILMHNAKMLDFATEIAGRFKSLLEPLRGEKYPEKSIEERLLFFLFQCEIYFQKLSGELSDVFAEEQEKLLLTEKEEMKERPTYANVLKKNNIHNDVNRISILKKTPQLEKKEETAEKKQINVEEQTDAKKQTVVSPVIPSKIPSPANPGNNPIPPKYIEVLMAVNGENGCTKITKVFMSMKDYENSIRL